MGRPLHVLELAALHRPEEKAGDHGHEDEAQGDEQIEYLHTRLYGSAQPGLQGGQCFSFMLWARRRELRTTSSEEVDMPMLAIQGVT